VENRRWEDIFAASGEKSFTSLEMVLQLVQQQH